MNKDLWFEKNFSHHTPVLISLPHSGLELHSMRQELRDLPREVFLRDVDWAVDEFWMPSARNLGVSTIRAKAHRYVIDLNRGRDEVHSFVVQGAKAPLPNENMKKVLFWSESTRGEALGPEGKAFQPLSQKVYRTLLDDIWEPYYASIEEHLQQLKKKFGFAVFLDAHSMPSVGTAFHGEAKARVDLVPGNGDGVTCAPQLNESFRNVAESQGFQVLFNDPYKGGHLTRYFGRPQEDLHALQIEVNRRLYMNEDTWVLNPAGMERMRVFTEAFLAHVITSKVRL